MDFEPFLIKIDNFRLSSNILESVNGVDSNWTCFDQIRRDDLDSDDNFGSKSQLNTIPIRFMSNFNPD